MKFLQLQQQEKARIVKAETSSRLKELGLVTHSIVRILSKDKGVCILYIGENTTPLAISNELLEKIEVEKIEN